MNKKWSQIREGAHCASPATNADQSARVQSLAMSLLVGPHLQLILDSDYAADVFYFVCDKSESDLALYHWKRNFDLFFMVHSAYNLWPQRKVTVHVVKSHCLDSTNDSLERYYRLGNEFADLAAELKTVAQEQGFVEYFQTRSSLWRYNEEAEHQWASFFEWCHAVASSPTFFECGRTAFAS